MADLDRPVPTSLVEASRDPHASVLIVDDEAPIVEAIAYSLKKEGYTVLTARSGEEGLRLARDARPSLIVLDLMLPGMSGLDVCRLLRSESDVPILMLTAKAEETDRVVGLELGADDYVTKPFSVRELAARIKSLLRRHRGEHRPKDLLTVGDIAIDRVRHVVTVEERVVALSPKEFDLLTLLATYPDQVFSRQKLLDRVWGETAFVEEHTVTVHIHWLREKIERAASKPTRLLTVRGFGYKLTGAS